MFTHYARHSDAYFAWSSCHCDANRTHFIGEEVHRPTPIGVFMSDIQNKRQALRDLYGDSWKAKVDKMPDTQIVALYLKFKREGKIK